MTLSKTNPTEFERTYAIEALEKELERIEYWERKGMKVPTARRAVEQAIHLLSRIEWPKCGKYLNIIDFPNQSELVRN